MSESMITQSQYDALNAFIDRQGRDQGALIAVLHQAQKIIGYLPMEVQLHIAQALGLPAAKVYGVVSFYSYFTETPKGRHPVHVCMGTACFVRGADKILKEFEHRLGIPVGGVSHDRSFSLDALRCVGACGLAPVVLIGEKVYGRVKIEDIPGILTEASKEEAAHEQN